MSLKKTPKQKSKQIDPNQTQLSQMTATQRKKAKKVRMQTEQKEAEIRGQQESAAVSRNVHKKKSDGKNTPKKQQINPSKTQLSGTPRKVGGRKTSKAAKSDSSTVAKRYAALQKTEENLLTLTERALKERPTEKTPVLKKQ